MGFPEDYRSLWIAIDTCIRTLNSTVRVDVGHSTGCKDPLVFLTRKYTQNNFESNLCSILIFFRFELGGEKDRSRGSCLFSQTCKELRQKLVGR